MLLYKLGYTTCFATIAFIKFYFGFPVLWLLYYTCSCPAFHLYFIPPVSCSYLIISWVVPLDITCFISTCLCSQRGFQCTFMIRIHWYTCAYPCSPPGFRITTRLGSSDSSGSSCPGLGAWTEGDSFCWGPSLLLRSRQTSCSFSPILAPPSWLAASLAISWAPFCTVHICTSLCILAFAPISDVIFL